MVKCTDWSLVTGFSMYLFSENHIAAWFTNQRQPRRYPTPMH